MKVKHINLCITFRISDCKHPKDMIFVSILTFFKAWDIENFAIINISQTLTLELMVIHIFPMTLLITGCMHAIDLILMSIIGRPSPCIRVVLYRVKHCTLI